MKTSYYLLSFFLYCAGGLFAQSQEIKEINDILYLEESLVEVDSLQRLNLVLPQQANKAPLLLWVGGGAWSYVNRNMEMDIARHFAKEGIAVASVGHRLSTALWRDSTRTEGVQHPKHIEDIAAAFKWLYDNADVYGYSRDKIFVGGFSSGGHLATLLSVDQRYLAKHDLSPKNISGVIPIGGAYDIVDYHRAFLNGSRKELAKLHVEAVFGDEDSNFIDASPTNYMDSLSVPMLIISENNTYNYTKILEEKIMETDFREFQVFHIHRLGHGDLWRNFSFEEESIYRNLIQDFIFTQTKS